MWFGPSHTLRVTRYTRFINLVARIHGIVKYHHLQVETEKKLFVRVVSAHRIQADRPDPAPGGGLAPKSAPF